MTKHLEDAELIAFFDWVRWNEKKNPILKTIFHVENERKCTPAQGARRKRKGVRAGIPDIIVPISRRPFCGLFIELKTDKGKVSKEQKEIMAMLYSLGHAVYIARSGKEAIDLVTNYLKS